MKRSALPAVLVGVVLAGTLIATNDPAEIARTLSGAGWGILLVIALHLPQILFSALGWRSLVETSTPPPISIFFRLRWIREAVNALLPVAQVGGDVVRARLLVLRGVPVRAATAAGIVDLSVELATQVMFTLAGVAVLLAGPHGGDAAQMALAATLAVGALALALAAAQRFGLLGFVERAAARWSSSGSGFPVDLAGLTHAARGLYRQPGRLWPSAGWHLLSWVAGVAETYAALAVLGLDPSLGEALVIEALGQAVRSAGFLIPGALGVQEGGFVLIGALFGIGPNEALTLSLVRRVRELALGLPGLLAWQRMEGQAARRPARPEIAA